jgi:uncharacterized protein YjiS (DUF1127 family)
MRSIGQVAASVPTHRKTHSPMVLLRSARARLRGCGAAIAMWFARSRQRRALAELDDRLLRDIGVTFEQARREAAKPFWSASRA